MFIFNSRTNLLSAIGNPPIHSSFIRALCQPTIFGTTANKIYPVHVIKVRSKPEFDV